MFLGQVHGLLVPTGVEAQTVRWLLLHPGSWHHLQEEEEKSASLVIRAYNSGGMHQKSDCSACVVLHFFFPFSFRKWKVVMMGVGRGVRKCGVIEGCAAGSLIVLCAHRDDFCKQMIVCVCVKKESGWRNTFLLCFLEVESFYSFIHYNSLADTII